MAQELVVNECVVKKSKVIIYLGATLDECLNFKPQIVSKCKTASFNLHLLRQIRKYLSLDAAKTIALGTIISHLDYANSLYCGLPEIEIKKLQRIQNFSAKVVLQTKTKIFKFH